MNRTIRRSKFGPATVSLALLCCMSHPAGAVLHDRPASEPYQLAGNRLVFTNWHFVRTGQLDWKDSEGKSVYASGSAALTPEEVHFDYYDLPVGIRLTAQPAERSGPIIPRDRPWDAMGIAVNSFFFDESRFRLWGRCQAANGEGFGAYYESEDGLNWIKPNLGLVEFDGNRDNNLLGFDRHLMVFKDPNGSPEESYKTVYDADFENDRFLEYRQRRPWSVMATETDPGRVHSIRAAVSPDGLRWTVLPEAISVEPSDTMITCYFDELLKKYVMYTRSYAIGPRAEGIPNPTERRHQFVQRRAIGRSESEDFRQFPLSEVIIETGASMPPTDTYYTNCRTTIPGASDHHLMFPAIYHQADDTTSIELFSSSDGKIWHRLPGSPVLDTSISGQWDGGCVFAVTAPGGASRRGLGAPLHRVSLSP